MKWSLLFLSLIGSAGTPALNAAQISWDVSLNTSSFALSSAGPFALDIQLNDGGLPGNNSAVLTNFNFGGGTFTGMPELFGGASGSVASGVTLNDSDFFNSFRQGFTAGSLLQFRLVLTTDNDGTGTPDQFSLAILDNTGIELPTTSLGFYGTSVLLLADLTGDAAPLQAFGSGTGSAVTFDAPSLTPVAGEVPEPSTMLPVALACTAGLGALRRTLARKQDPAA